MNISTRGKYGLSSIIELALKSGDVVPLKNIAESQNISESYLEQLFATLKKVGIVKSVRGAYGGYYIGRNLNEITVGDILRALEGDMSMVNCEEKKSKRLCRISDLCATKILWEKLEYEIKSVIDSITIFDLVEEYNNTVDNNMYYI